MPRPKTNAEAAAFNALSQNEKIIHMKAADDRRLGLIRAASVAYPGKEEFVAFLVRAHPDDFQREETMFIYEMVTESVRIANGISGTSRARTEELETQLADVANDNKVFREKATTRLTRIYQLEDFITSLGHTPPLIPEV